MQHIQEVGERMTTAALHARQSARKLAGLARARSIGDSLTGWSAAAVALLNLIAPVSAAQAGTARAVDATALLSAADNREDWLTHGRTYDEQRFSPLDRINTGNVKSLGLAWFADLDTARGQEATPLVIDGTVYITTAWSKVKAYDAVTGRLRW